MSNMLDLLYLPLCCTARKKELLAGMDIALGTVCWRVSSHESGLTACSRDIHSVSSPTTTLSDGFSTALLLFV